MGLTSLMCSALKLALSTYASAEKKKTHRVADKEKSYS